MLVRGPADLELGARRVARNELRRHGLRLGGHGLRRGFRALADYVLQRGVGADLVILGRAGRQIAHHVGGHGGLGQLLILAGRFVKAADDIAAGVHHGVPHQTVARGGDLQRLEVFDRAGHGVAGEGLGGGRQDPGAVGGHGDRAHAVFIERGGLQVDHAHIVVGRFAEQIELLGLGVVIIDLVFFGAVDLFPVQLVAVVGRLRLGDLRHGVDGGIDAQLDRLALGRLAAGRQKRAQGQQIVRPGFQTLELIARFGRFAQRIILLGAGVVAQQLHAAHAAGSGPGDRDGAGRLFGLLHADGAHRGRGSGKRQRAQQADERQQQRERSRCGFGCFHIETLLSDVGLPKGCSIGRVAKALSERSAQTPAFAS